MISPWDPHVSSLFLMRVCFWGRSIHPHKRERWFVLNTAQRHEYGCEGEVTVISELQVQAKPKKEDTETEKIASTGGGDKLITNSHKWVPKGVTDETVQAR